MVRNGRAFAHCEASTLTFLALSSTYTQNLKPRHVQVSDFQNWRQKNPDLISDADFQASKPWAFSDI
jgi:hypothetical protein